MLGVGAVTGCASLFPRAAGWGRGAVLSALLVAALLAAFGGSAKASSLRASACKVQKITFENDWDIGSASLKLVRTGTWTSGGGTVAATETDIMSPLRHRLHYPYAFSVGQPGACLPWTWGLSTSNALDDGFERGGMQSLSGSWSALQMNGSTASGTCEAHQSFTISSRDLLPFILNLAPARLNMAAKRVIVRIDLQTPYGLSCAKTPARFDYPVPPEQSILSQPITVATRTLKRHGRFTLSFSGSVSHQEPWSYDDGTVKLRLTWSGRITFIPTVCSETIITKRAVEERPVCYRG
jgi:hypothetical protein